MNQLTQIVKNISKDIGINPSQLNIYCEPSIDRDGEVLHLIDIVYHDLVYQTLSYYKTEDIVREFRAINDEFPNLEIHV